MQYNIVASLCCAVFAGPQYSSASPLRRNMVFPVLPLRAILTAGVCIVSGCCHGLCIATRLIWRYGLGGLWYRRTGSGWNQLCITVR